MSPLFQSFEYLNRDSGERALESTAPRTIFLWLIAALLMLGALGGIELYGLIRWHKFDWTIGLIVLVNALSVFFQARLIYRRLDR